MSDRVHIDVYRGDGVWAAFCSFTKPEKLPEVRTPEFSRMIWDKLPIHIQDGFVVADTGNPVDGAGKRHWTYEQLKSEGGKA